MIDGYTAALNNFTGQKNFIVNNYFYLSGKIINYMPSGKVKWFNTTKGFGFITPDEGGSDVFVHISALQAAGLRGLDEGQSINYELVSEKGKVSAGNLSVA